MPTALYKIKTFGDSMYPLLLDGDIIYINKIPFRGIQTNDIITVRKKRKIFTHRVIYRTETYLITKGDNNLQSDGKVFPHQIVGKVGKIKRKNNLFDLKYFYLFQSTIYFQEIVSIKKQFEKAHIDFLILKGLPLHLLYEKKHPERVYVDCDFLIKKIQFDQCSHIFRKAGYRIADTSFSTIHKKIKDKETEISFYKFIHGILITFDIHLEVVFLMNQLGKLPFLYPENQIDSLTTMFLREKRIIKIQDETFPLLSHENLVLYLSLHLFHHNFRGIHRLRFLAIVIKKSLPLSLEQKIIAYNLQNFIYPCFIIVKKYFLVKIPLSLFSSIKPKNNIYNYIQKRFLQENIFDEDLRIKSGVNRFKTIFFLSPNPLLIKLITFTSPQVMYNILWILWKKISVYSHQRIFSNLNNNFQS